MGRDALGVEELEHATVGPGDAADVKPARDNQLVELDYVGGSEAAASRWLSLSQTPMLYWLMVDMIVEIDGHDIKRRIALTDVGGRSPGEIRSELAAELSAASSKPLNALMYYFWSRSRRRKIPLLHINTITTPLIKRESSMSTDGAQTTEKHHGLHWGSYDIIRRGQALEAKPGITTTTQYIHHDVKLAERAADCRGAEHCAVPAAPAQDRADRGAQPSQPFRFSKTFSSCNLFPNFFLLSLERPAFDFPLHLALLSSQHLSYLSSFLSRCSGAISYYRPLLPRLLCFLAPST
jgi:hypothetical protein